MSRSRIASRPSHRSSVFELSVKPFESLRPVRVVLPLVTVHPDSAGFPMSSSNRSPDDTFPPVSTAPENVPAASPKSQPVPGIEKPPEKDPRVWSLIVILPSHESPKLMSPASIATANVAEYAPVMSGNVSGSVPSSPQETTANARMTARTVGVSRVSITTSGGGTSRGLGARIFPLARTGIQTSYYRPEGSATRGGWDSQSGAMVQYRECSSVLILCRHPPSVFL